MTINSLVPLPVTPTITAVSTVDNSTAGPITGGTRVTITGTGFVQGAAVNFLEETGGAPANDNVSLPGASVAVVTPTSITASTPAITSGTTYFVTVTTPTGTSAYGPGDVFTYLPMLPTLTSTAPTTGETAGGTSVMLTGTGFYSGATVSFVQESGGTPVSPGVTFSGTNVALLSATSITAVSPAVTSSTTFFVTVTTPTGTTGNSAVFTFTPLFPTVSGISPTHGPPGGGTPMTITGTGFVNGSTVSFVQESGGNQSGPGIPAVGVSVNSATSISANTPAMTASTTYFVTVTTPSGTSGYYPIFTSP